jgi:hypothetical protein
MTSKPQRIERLQVAIPLDELKAIEDFRLIRRGLATSEKQTSASKKNRKTRYLKIFYRIRFAPLEKNWPFPKSLAAGCPKWTRCGRRRMSDALLISMLLNGGCGYEDYQPRPLLADQHWL